MPFSLQVGTADQASVGTGAVLNAGGTAGTQAASAVGDAFAALMQAALPSVGSAASTATGKPGSSTQQTDQPAPPARPRKCAADVPDPAAAPVLIALLPVPVAASTSSLASSQVAGTAAEEEPTGATPYSSAAAQGHVPAEEHESSTGVSVDSRTAEETNAAAWQLLDLHNALPSAVDTAKDAVLTPPALQPSAAPASAMSASALSHVSRTAVTPASTPAAYGSSPKYMTADANQKQAAQIDSSQSLPNMTAASDVTHAPARHGATVSTDASRNILAGDATASAPPAASDAPQGTLVDMAAQASFAGQGAPATGLDVQTSGGNASSDSQDNAGGGTPAARKNSQGATRMGTTSEGDSRVGMGGWIASTQHAGSAAAQRSAAESAPLASSGMTNMSLDRIASESSARRLTNALRSDMSFGVQTDAFGKVNIQAALHGDQLASQISLEQPHLHASMLATHMPTLELKLGEKYNLSATVTVGASSTNSSANQQSSSQQNSRQSTAGVSLQKVSSTSDHAGSVPTLLPEQRQTQERQSPATGRLDLVI